MRYDAGSKSDVVRTTSVSGGMLDPNQKRMKGKLNDQPLAELVREISVKGLSGTLRLEHERAQTAVYFDNGQVIYAASNLKTLRLREYLTKRGLSTDKVPPNSRPGFPIWASPRHWFRQEI